MGWKGWGGVGCDFNTVLREVAISKIGRLAVDYTTHWNRFRETHQGVKKNPYEKFRQNSSTDYGGLMCDKWNLQHG